MAQINDNEILIAGGSTGQLSKPTRSTLILSLDSLTYSTGGDLVNEEGVHSCAFFQGKVYLAAKGDRKTEVFDPRTNKWSSGITLPYQMRTFGNLVAVKNNLFYSDSKSIYKIVKTTDNETWEHVYEVQVTKPFKHTFSPSFVMMESNFHDNEKCRFPTL